jgi:hypothetical protein
LVIALYLHILAAIDKGFQLGIGDGQNDFRQLLEIPFIALVYVVLFTFGEPIDEKRQRSLAEKDDRPIPAGLAFIRSLANLANHLLLKIRIDPTARLVPYA